jgi:hypothetical protein
MYPLFSRENFERDINRKLSASHQTHPQSAGGMDKTSITPVSELASSERLKASGSKSQETGALPSGTDRHKVGKSKLNSMGS